MADEKIIDLTAIVTQSMTDLKEVSANGTGSFKETRQQDINYTQAHLNNVAITGGTINGTTIGATTKAAGSFTNLTATGIVNFPNNYENTVYVSPQGSDSIGNGTLNNPYATVSYAQSQVVPLASPSNVYTIFVTGNITDNGNVYISPNVGVFAPSPDISITNTNNIIADPAWATAVPGSSYSYWQNLAIYGDLAIDFSAMSSSIFPFFQFIQTYFEGSTFSINGDPSSTNPGTSVYFYQCYSSANVDMDNVFIYSADNQWTGQVNLGSGTPSSCVQHYSIGDIFYEAYNFTDSNGSSCSPFLQSNGSAFNGGITVATQGAVSNIQFTVIATVPSCGIEYYVGSIGTGSITCVANGSGKLAGITVDDYSTGGTQVNLTLDGPPAALTINSGTPNITYNYVSESTNNDFTGFNYFSNATLFPSQEVSYSTTSTFSASDFVIKKTISSNPTGTITLTLPSASSIDTLLGSPSVNMAIEGISITNFSLTGSIQLGNGSGTTLGGVPTSIISPSTTRFFKLRKSTTGPAYILYG
jgi:hypothetical protein